MMTMKERARVYHARALVYAKAAGVYSRIAVRLPESGCELMAEQVKELQQAAYQNTLIARRLERM